MTNLNIIVVVAATLHNFMEWSILANLLLLQQDRRSFNAYAGVWCWFVALMVMYIPDILIAFEFEEVTGIWPDFFLLITSGYLAKTANNLTRKLPYRFYFEGATWHIIQIFALLSLGFGFIDAEVSGVIIFVTALPNYWYYSEFALYYDGLTKPPAFPLFFSTLCGCMSDADHMPPHNDEDAPIVTHNLNGDVIQHEDVYPSPSSLLTYRLLKIMIAVSFGFAFFFVAVPPLTLRLCHDVGFACLDSDSGNVWQLTLFKSNPESNIWADVVSRSNNPQNLQLRFFEGQANYAGYYLVLEKWSTKIAMIAANADSKFSNPDFNIVFRYGNFMQVETTPDFFSECNDEDVLHKYIAERTPFEKKKGGFKYELDGCRANDMVGFTLASLTDRGLLYGLDAMAYGLRSRFENGSISYNVFFGGANSGMENPSFDGSTGKNLKIMVVERWRDAYTLREHLHTKTVDYIHAVAGLTTVPTSILLSSPFDEWLPKCHGK
jgi:quinol monooxygenase YgiN